MGALPSFRGDAKHRTRNLEVPGSPLRGAPERRVCGFQLAASSIRLWQAERFLGNETQNQFPAHRRNPWDQRLPQVTLDVELLGIAEAAMGHHRLFAGVEAGFGGEIFR